MMTTRHEVLDAFRRLTGIRMPLPSMNINHAADLFAQTYSISDLETVISWIQNEIRCGRLDTRSLQWTTMMGTVANGNLFESFDGRLAMAQKTVRTRPAPKAMPVTTDTGDGKVTRLTLVEPADEATPEMRERIAASLSELTRKLSA